MRFKIAATFEADDIDDAFEKLAEHFKRIAENGLDMESPFDGALEFEIDVVAEDGSDPCPEGGDHEADEDGICLGCGQQVR